jgi:HAD superfamily hydrolase (TIGR01509 family)
MDDGVLKLIVFDCDGVLFDSREANRRYYNHLLEEFGRPLMDDDELEYVHTHNADLATRHIFRRCPGEVERAEAFRRGLDYTPFLRYMKMEPGLKEFLTLARRRYRTAISTNRTTTMAAVLEMSGLGPFFDMIVTALDVAKPKPHPEALLRILEHFGLRAEEGIFIGDSEVDRQHSAAAGMEMIAFRNASLSAEYHADSFEEVARLPIFPDFRG